jgi:hypothetical protein
MNYLRFVDELDIFDVTGEPTEYKHIEMKMTVQDNNMIYIIVTCVTTFCLFFLIYCCCKKKERNCF